MQVARLAIFQTLTYFFPFLQKEEIQAVIEKQQSSSALQNTKNCIS